LRPQPTIENDSRFWLKGIPDFKNKRVAKPAAEHRFLSHPQAELIFRQKAGPAMGSEEVWKGMIRMVKTFQPSPEDDG